MTDDLTALKSKTVSLNRVKMPPYGGEDLKKYRTTSVDSAISCGGSDESKGQEGECEGGGRRVSVRVWGGGGGWREEGEC